MNAQLRKQLIYARSARIHVGSKVRYAGNFLHDTGQFTGDSAFLVGEVTKIEPFGENRLVHFTSKVNGLNASGRCLDCNLVCTDEPDMSADW